MNRGEGGVKWRIQKGGLLYEVGNDRSERVCQPYMRSEVSALFGLETRLTRTSPDQLELHDCA